MPADDIPDALEDLFGADPTLTAALPGGLYEDEAPSAVAYPYATIEDVSEDDPGETLEDRPVDLTISVYATDRAAAKTAADAILSVLSPASGRSPLTCNQGQEAWNEVTSGRPFRAEGKGPGGVTVWQVDLGYRFWLQTAAP